MTLIFGSQQIQAWGWNWQCRVENYCGSKLVLGHRDHDSVLSQEYFAMEMKDKDTGDLLHDLSTRYIHMFLLFGSQG